MPIAWFFRPFGTDNLVCSFMLATHKRYRLDTPRFEITLNRFWLSAEKIIAPVQLIAATE